MRIVLPICVLALFISCSDTKKSFVFQVSDGEEISVSRIASIGLEKIAANGINIEEPLLLFQKIDGEAESINYQIDTKHQKLRFVINPEVDSAESTFKIENGISSQKLGDYLSEHKEKGDLQLTIDQKALLSYRYEMTYPPEGVDSVYEKSGYIHPLITFKGDTLTRIQPPDHYHHYGIWGPWTHTQVDGQQVDFWNLGDGKGTVLFKQFEDTQAGNVFASFTAAQEHIDKLTKEKPQVALNENLEVRLWDIGRDDRYIFDYISNFNSPLDDGILLEAYRYGGGMGMRFNERWKAENCSVLTSEGKDRLTADGSTAKWCIVSGISSDGEGTSGILFMSHPENRSHPEPMRIWPIDANEGRGDMFFEFCPIRHEEWQIESEKKYNLSYRMVVFDGELNAAEAEAYWHDFAHPPQIREVEPKN